MKKDLIPYCLLLIAAVSLFWACSKAGIDISSKTITLIAPDDSMSTTNNQLNFAWVLDDEATKYNIQIFALSGNKREQLLVNKDTVSAIYTFTFSNPGKYEWTVFGKNSVSTTGAKFRRFTIDTASDISKLVVGVVSPVDNYYTNKDSILLKWNKVFGASSYTIQAYDTDSTGDELMDAISTNQTYCVIPGKGSSLLEKTYSWSVVAKSNAQVQSKKTWRKIIVDKTAPQKPEFAIKAADTSITVLNQTYLIRWKRLGTEVAAFDSLYFKNSSNQIIAATKVVGDSTKCQLSIPTLAAKYKVYVLSVDKAGNRSTKDSVSITFQ